MNTAETIEKRLLDDVFYRARSFFPSGVVVVSAAEAGGTPFGFTASTFCAVSCQPPLISVSVATDSRSLASLRLCRNFAVSVLSDSQAHLAKLFGTPGSPCFDHSSCCTTETGVPVILGAVLQLICQLQEIVPAGDHCLILAGVSHLTMLGGRPLVYWRRAFFSLHLEYPFLADVEALADFVKRWRGGALSRAAWTHSAHIAVSAYYAFDHSPEELFQIMKEGIIRFNHCVGVSNGPDAGYHDTLTRFWANVVSAAIPRGAFESPLDAARQAVRLFGEDRDLHNLYYSFDVVRCRQARRAWLPPDRLPSIQYSRDSLIAPEER